ncbi:MAG: hypothetical protein FWD57_15770, partial [Polyangiaceae bacterium]|nr:hypothetical protein [Polyangiaceae bacterium]
MILDNIQLRISSAWTSLRNNPKLRVFRPWIVVVAACVIAGAAVVMHSRHYLPHFMDDGWISLRYSQRFLEGNGLTWNDGERVEGYTNLLWVLLCAAIGAFRVDLVDASRLLGQASAITAVVALAANFGFRRDEQRPFAATILPPLFLAASGCIAVWAIAGLEADLVAACLALGLFAIYRNLNAESPLQLPRSRWIIAGIPLAMLCLTRGDGAMFAGCVAIGVLIAGHTKGLGGSLRRPSGWWLVAVMWLMLLPVAFSLAQLLFRLAYYGAWVPNTATAKVAFTSERFMRGYEYLRDAILPNKALIFIALSAIVPFIRDDKARSRLLVMVPLAIIAALYISSIGGDLFLGRRHIVIFVVLATFFAGESIQWFMARKSRIRISAAIAAITCLGIYFVDQLSDKSNSIATTDKWAWDGKPVGEMLGRHFRATSARVAVDAAGSIPFYSRLPSIDMLGLNDRFLATNPPPSFGKRNIGHDLGNGEYVLGREPDLVIFQLCRGAERARYRSGIDMQATSAFTNGYSLIKFETPGPESVPALVWVRRESPRLGVEIADDRVVLPGF